MDKKETINKNIERLQHEKKRADALIAAERKRLAKIKQDEAEKQARDF
jgi:hypothetical protein